MITLPKESVWVDRQTKKLNVNIWPKQKEFIDSDSIDEIFYGGAAGGGKILALDGVILTPFGFKKCRDLNIGDAVNNPDGSIAHIIQLHPIRSLDKWTVYFHDGTKTEVAKEHLWLAWKAQVRKKKNGKGCFGEKSAQIVETQELQRWLKRGISPLIPVCEEQRFNINYRWPSKIDPYLLGLLLGDGCIGHGNHGGGLSITSNDFEHLKRELVAYQYSVYKMQHSFRKESFQTLRKELKKLRLWGTYSHDKFVPRQFLLSSSSSRLSLLQGLLDTDGTVDSRGQVYFTSTSKQLSEDVKFLVQSLGGTATLFEKRPFCKVRGKKKWCRTAYTLYIKHRKESSLFRLERKKERCRDEGWMYRRIVKIEVKGKITGRCVTVSHPNGLYLTNDFIVTHNSEALLHFCLKRRMQHPGTVGIIFRRKFPDLEKTLIPRSHAFFLRVGAKYNSSKHLWVFPNGSKQWFGFCENENDVYSHQCFHPATDILTKNGWKNVSQLQVGEVVASLNPHTRQMEYQAISKFWKYKYSGDMYTLHQKNGISFSVTPNHRIWASTERVKKLRSYEVKHLPSVARIPQWCKWRGKTDYRIRRFLSDGHNGKYVSFTVNQWMEFLGWFLSEGCIDKHRWSVRISQVGEEGKDQIRRLLKAANINFWEQEKEFSFSSKKLCLYLEQFGDCFKKHIPRDVLFYARPQLRLLLNALVEGDGCWDDDKFQAGRFVTTSKQLKDDVMELAFKCGYKVTSCYYEKRKSVFYNDKPIWYLSFHKKITDTSIRSSSYGISNTVKKEKFSGKVFCVTVPPHHSVLIRYKGRLSWSGQSAEYHDMCFDEASHFTFFQFSYLTSRCRSALAGVKPLIRLASNPGGVGHLWLKKRYVDPGMVNKKWYLADEQKSLAFIPARLEDNPSLRLADPTYENRLKILGEKKFKALRWGDWNVFEGQFFSEWSKDHVLTYNRVPDTHSKKILCMDWGYHSPGPVYWLEITTSGRIFCYRELVLREMAPKEYAEAICKCCPREERYSALWAPPELWGKEVELEGGGQPIQKLMQTVFNKMRSDIIMQKANNARVPGWLKVREYLRLAPDGFPWFQISPSCEYLIETLPALLHDEHRPEDLDSSGEDHACVVGETYVQTRNGLEKIKDLVGTTGDVWALGGWHKYKGVQMTGQQVDVYRLQVGKHWVECTLTHKLITKKGRIPLNELKRSDVLVDVGLCGMIHLVTWNLKLFLLQFKNLMEQDFIKVLIHIFRQKGNAFIAWYGNFIKEKFRQNFMYTTGTIISPITPLQISNFYPLLYTFPTTLRLQKQKHGQENWWREYAHLQKSGINLPKEESGIVHMEKKHGLEEKKSLNIVKNVQRFIKQHFLRGLNFVTSTVKCVTSENDLVAGSELTISYIGKRDVYNMYVEDVNCYGVNGGLLISNCDAIRYGLVSLNTVAQSSLSPYGVQTIDRVFGNEGEYAPISRIEMKGRGGYGS